LLEALDKVAFAGGRRAKLGHVEVGDIRQLRYLRPAARSGHS
jgi:hypothetical protein